MEINLLLPTTRHTEYIIFILDSPEFVQETQIYPQSYARRGAGWVGIVS
jgi:hypothetical protein